MNSIPASELVSVIPGVLGAGGNPLSLNAIFLTDDPSIPLGTVQPFSTLDAVREWFGATSREADLAAVYFNGFTGNTTLPGTLYFAQFNQEDVAAYLRGGSVSGMTLAQLQALSGTIIVTVNGEVVTSANIDLTGATSFSNAAALVEAGLQSVTAIFNGTGTIDDGAGGAGTVLTISAVTSGVLHAGDVIIGVGVTAGTTVVEQVDGTPGGIGTYTISAPFDLGPIAITVAGIGEVSYDSQLAAFVITSPAMGALSTIGFASGTLAPGLKLRLADGAVTSQGAAAVTPAALMSSIIAVTQNWATFMTIDEVDLDTKLAFAAWATTSNQRYLYVCQDSDVTALSANADLSFGAIVKAAAYNGVCPVWNPSGLIAAFVCGTTAAINFSETNGRITYAYRGQAGLPPDITDATVADNLTGNGYNFYAAYATANDQFVNFQHGSLPGTWRWMDPYVNQIYFNSQLQLALMELETNSKSIPYNQDGYNLMRTAIQDPVDEAINFGTIRTGVELSASQKAQVNLAAGTRIDQVLFQQGWYLQILPANSVTRGERGSPPSRLWYTDGGSIQKINLSSTDVQ